MMYSGLRQVGHGNNPVLVAKADYRDENSKDRDPDPAARRNALCRRRRRPCALCRQPSGMRTARRDPLAKERSRRAGPCLAALGKPEPLTIVGLGAESRRVLAQG